MIFFRAQSECMVASHDITAIYTGGLVEFGIHSELKLNSLKEFKQEILSRLYNFAFFIIKLLSMSLSLSLSKG